MATGELYELCSGVYNGELDGEYILKTNNRVWDGKGYYTIPAGTTVVILPSGSWKVKR